MLVSQFTLAIFVVPWIFPPFPYAKGGYYEHVCLKKKKVSGYVLSTRMNLCHQRVLIFKFLFVLLCSFQPSCSIVIASLVTKAEQMSNK